MRGDSPFSRNRLIITGSPSVCIREIEARQSIVSLFCVRPHLRDDIIVMLKGLEDASRLVQKLSLGRGETDDLLNIRKAILGWARLRQRLHFEKELDLQKRSRSAAEEWQNIDLLLSHMVDLSPLAERIGNTVDAIDFDKKERLSGGFESESSDTDESDVPDELDALPFGRPPYGGRWRIKPQYDF